MRLPTVAIIGFAVSAAGCNSLVSRGVLTQAYPTMSINAFDSVVNGINWVDGNTRQRCANAACTDSVSVRIDANESAYTIDSVNGGPHGTLVARVRNLGGSATYMYHFRPAPYLYYFLVRPSGVSSKWILLEKLAGFPAAAIDSGAFTGCFDHRAAKSARADFKDCGPRIPSASPGAHIVAVATPTAVLSAALNHLAAEAKAWIGCAYGCCPM